MLLKTTFPFLSTDNISPKQADEKIQGTPEKETKETEQIIKTGLPDVNITPQSEESISPTSDDSCTCQSTQQSPNDDDDDKKDTEIKGTISFVLI